MIMLHKLYLFNIGDAEMVNIYILYIRSVLEQSCQVRSFSITLEEKENIERVQKVACRIILKDSYIDYNHALAYFGLESLSERRAALCQKFAKNCLRHEQTRICSPSIKTLKMSETKKITMFSMPKGGDFSKVPFHNYRGN